MCASYRKTLLGFLCLCIFIAISQTCSSQQDNTSTADTQTLIKLISDLKGTKDRQDKLTHLHLLRETNPQTKEEIKAVIGLLDDEDSESKCTAMVLLGKIKEKKAVRKIIKLLTDKDDAVKATAAAVLGEIGDERAIEPLLEDFELIVLEFGQCPVAKFGAPALPELNKVAKKKSLLGLLPKQEKKDIRSRKAAYCIGQIRDEKAIPALMKLLEDEDNDVRLASVQALAAMKVKEAESEFEKMLNDKEMEIRWATLDALINVNREKYIPIAIELLSDPIMDYKATEILGKLKEKSAVPKLERMLEHKNDMVRYYAATALWRITGKIYAYKKTKQIENMNNIDKREINAMIKRKESIKSIESYFERRRDEGYLWEYSSLDELLVEIKSSGGKYDYK